MNSAMKIGVRDRIAVKSDNKGFAPVIVDIGRCLAKEIHIAIFFHGAIIGVLSLKQQWRLGAIGIYLTVNSFFWAKP